MNAYSRTVYVDKIVWSEVLPYRSEPHLMDTRDKQGNMLLAFKTCWSAITINATFMLDNWPAHSSYWQNYSYRK